MAFTKKIVDLAKQVVDDEVYFVAELEERGNNKFVVYVDGYQRVLIEHCARWNTRLREEIEQHIPEFASGNFELELSSFGVGRPLCDERQYVINKGRKVVVQYMDENQSTPKVEGLLKEVDEESIVVEVKSKKKPNELIKINRNNIRHIHIEVVF